MTCKCCDAGTENNSCKGPLFKVGDKVYSLIDGWGIVEVPVTNSGYPVTVRIRNGGERQYESNGSYYKGGQVVLFHDKPTITPAKRKVKKWLWAGHDKQGNNKVSFNHYSEEQIAKEAWCVHYVKLPWTETIEEE